MPGKVGAGQARARGERWRPATDLRCEASRPVARPLPRSAAPRARERAADRGRGAGPGWRRPPQRPRGGGAAGTCSTRRRRRRKLIRSIQMHKALRSPELSLCKGSAKELNKSRSGQQDLGGVHMCERGDDVANSPKHLDFRNIKKQDDLVSRVLLVVLNKH